MGFKGKRSFYKLGAASVLFGAIITLIGSRPASDTWLQITYASEFYRAIAIVTIGAGLVLAGLIVIAIGMLKTE